MRTIALGTVVLGLTLALGVGDILAQGPYDRCAGGNPAIRTWLEQGRFPEPLVLRNRTDLDDAYGTSNARWASSHLAASGTPPTRLPPLPFGRRLGTRYPVDSAGLANALWTCQYSADRVTDTDTSTAWCEGVPGDGIGEVVLFAPGFGFQNDPVGFQIRTGYGKSESLLRANGRPREARVWYLDPASWSSAEIQTRRTTTFVGLRVLTTQLVQLQDVNGWQRLAFPDSLKAGLPQHPWVAAFEIRSVYPGSRYRDTCITEIRMEFPPDEM